MEADFRQIARHEWAEASPRTRRHARPSRPAPAGREGVITQPSRCLGPVATAVFLCLVATFSALGSVLAADQAPANQILVAAALAVPVTPGPASRLKHTLWRATRSILFIATASYLGLTAYLAVFQARLVYYPSTDRAGTPRDIGLTFEDLRLRTSDGGEIHAWHVPASTRERGTVLICHGNAGNISHRLGTLKVFHDLGFATLIFDYRGYGQSPGRPGEERSYQDSLAAWRYLTESRGIAPQRICVFGRSLGGAIAAWLAKTTKPGLLVVESTFVSIPRMGRDLYPFLPVALVCRMGYSTAEYLQQVTCPVVVIHGPGDEMIGFRHGEELYRVAPEPKRFITLSGGHNDGALASGDTYTRDLDRALSELLPNASPEPNAAPGNEPGSRR